MPWESQEIATFILVFGAFAYLSRTVYSKFFAEVGEKSSGGSCGSCGSCGSNPAKACSTEPNIVTIGQTANLGRKL